ncbi:MAG TPA: hypothetical protein PKM88_13710 [bacterium]|nr:hypothetical protein [bacterium]
MIAGSRLRCRHWLFLLLLLVCTAVLYAPVRAFDFIAIDDPELVQNNPLIRECSPTLFAQPVGGLYNPVTICSYALNYRRTGLQPGPFHCTNIALHLIAVVLVFFLARRLHDAPGVALLAAALFALHPLQVETVAWISARKELLCGVFSLGAVLAHSAARRHGTWWRHAITVSCYLLALGSLPIAAMLPLLFVVLDWYLGVNPFTRRRLVVTALLLLAALPVLAANLIVALPSAEDVARPAGLASAIMISAFTVLRSFVTAALPLALAVRYHYPPPALPATAAATFAILALVLLALHLRRRSRLPLFALLWWMLLLLPTLPVVALGSDRAARAPHDRYLYLPLAAAAVATAAALHALGQRRHRPRLHLAALLLGILLPAAAAALSARQLAGWRNTITLLTHEHRLFPAAAQPLIDRSICYRDSSNFAPALRDITAAIALAPQQATPYLVRGQLHELAGNPAAAAADFRTGLALPGADDNNLLHLATMLGQTGDTVAARQAVSAYIDRHPREAYGYYLRAQLAYQYGDRSAALADCTLALQLAPAHEPARRLAQACRSVPARR